MGLLGRGALVIWHEPTPECESDYNEWHSKEHMIERVAVPGFNRGHRYIALDASPGYLNFYEVDSLATLTSRPYLDRLNDPTPWSRRVVPTLHNNMRTLCSVIASSGHGIGGFVLTMRLTLGKGGMAGLDGRLGGEILSGMADRPGVLGTHLLQGDAQGSQIMTAEKRLRDQPARWTDAVILVIGYSAGALTDVRDGELAPQILQGCGVEEVASGLYRHVHTITNADIPD